MPYVSVFLCVRLRVWLGISLDFGLKLTQYLHTLTQRTTTTDDASFMTSHHLSASSDPWPQSDTDSESNLKSESQRPKFYHQYQSLNHQQQQQQQQAFKVQRSPDGKLNLVFNDPLVSLQTTQQRPPATSQPAPTTPPRRPTISDSKCKISIYISIYIYVIIH